jgi:antitoxin component YwqK of YwqJK toxin-antitoxin module
MIIEETDPGLEYAGHDEGGGLMYRFNGVPFTGVVISRHASGIILMEVSYVNGYENGRIREYDSNGNLYIEFYVKLNIRYGIRTEWDENGNVIETYDLGPEP